jgi:hypothetical protein
MTTQAESLIRQIEALIHEDVGRNVGPLFEATRGNLARAAEAIARSAPSIGVLTGFYVPLGDPPAAETDGPVGSALLAAALTEAGIACRLLTDEPCASGCQAALEAAGMRDRVTLDVVPVAAPLGDMIATWRDAGVAVAIAVERCGRTAGGPPRNMRGVDISPHTAPLDELFLAGPWTTVAIGDGGNELGLGALPRALVAQHVANGELITSITPAEHLIMAGVSHWGCYALIAAIAMLRPEWRDAMLRWLDPEVDAAILEHMIAHGPAVDGVTQRRTRTIDAIGMNVHREKLAAIAALIT